MDITRSEFLRLFAGAGLGALTLSKLGACGGSDAETPDAPRADAPQPDGPPADGPPADGPPADTAPASCTQNDPMAVIGFNHGHAFAMPITKEDVMAGQLKTYNIQGTSTHPHTVTVTAAMFAMLQQNMQVTVTSSVDDGHPHSVTIRCV